MKFMQHTATRVVVGILILLFLGFIYVSLFMFKPGSFYIKDFNQTIGNNTVNLLAWTKSDRAISYKVIIKNSDDKVIKELSTSKNSIIINDLEIKPNDNILIDVIAYNKKGKMTNAKESKAYVWELPVIQVASNKMKIKSIDDITDLNVKVLSDDSIDNYYLVVTKNDQDLFKVDYNGNDSKIKSEVFKNLDNTLGNYNILLCTNVNNQRVVISKKELLIMPVPITDIEVTALSNNLEIPFADLLIDINGGENADDFHLTLQDSNNQIIINNAIIENKKAYIGTDKLQPNSSYTLSITAHHVLDSSYTKTQTYNFTVADKQKVSSIASTRPSGEIGINRAIRLSTNTEGAKIYYTVDGSVPTEDSILYTGSIFIDKDTDIRAIAIVEDMKDSDILNLHYIVAKKTPTIYLSPSTQSDNQGVAAAGYTTEMEIMNKVSDYIEQRLKSKGVIVYRNNPDMTLSEIVEDSSSYDVDMHLAIHSNSYDGQYRGVETWIHDATCTTAGEIASHIQAALMNIYYNPNGDRGVKYSTSLGGMRETNPMNVTNGVLVEVAFHDNYEDAKWIVNHEQQIGYTIADTVASYFEK